MKITKAQSLILYSLGSFYQSVNQSLTYKHLRLRISKITFIELLLDSKIISKQERALYKNLESLEKKNLIEYNNRKIKFSEEGLKQYKKIEKEISRFNKLDKYFNEGTKSKRKLQTVIED
ncbi:hypothetical protein HN652_01060 [archaeon]|jgi:hypothetical protein|nr:hypothetical protein [archaeon]MBT6868919.1 hypothetical protein [archaeon]MBT7192860.1 hypothetical protein [archaeon]MBT7380826.1 hypothetical protein [archaeon]MBT7507581.1 hypothetical protein [archaeon]